MRWPSLLLLGALLRPCAAARYGEAEKENKEEKEKVLPEAAIAAALTAKMGIDIGMLIKHLILSVDEARFRTGDFSQQTKLSRSHVAAILQVGQGGEMPPDDWVALEAYKKLLDRTAQMCQSDNAGTGLGMAVGYVSGALGFGGPTADPEYEQAIETLMNESTDLAESVVSMRNLVVCPELGKQITEEVRQADKVATAYWSETGGNSLYRVVAAETAYGEDPQFGMKLYYDEVLDSSCFQEHAGMPQAEAQAKQVPQQQVMMEAQGRQLKKQYEKFVSSAAILYGEFAQSCSLKQRQADLGLDARHIARCIPELRDAMMSAGTKSKFAALPGAAMQVVSSAPILGPIMKWASGKKWLRDTYFGVLSGVDIVSGTTFGASWFSSLSYLTYRATQKLPIREDCIRAARKSKTKLKED